MSKVPYFKAGEIAPRTWMIEYAFTAPKGGGPYAYLLEGNDYALVIDTMLGYGNLRAFCETLTDKPLRLVNTHFHPDHINGNFDFDACWLHPLDLPYFYSLPAATREEIAAHARREALPEYRDLIEPEDFTPKCPMHTLPIFDGDIFDLGGRSVEVVEVGGHTPGSIVLIDRTSRIAFTGDACNGNTLMDFGVSLSVEEYLDNLLYFKRHQDGFDVMYGGHQVLPPETIDEGIELCAKIISGTDDKEIRPGMFGKPTVYAARHADNGFARADGKNFNISYNPEKIMDPGPRPQVIRLDPPSGL